MKKIADKFVIMCMILLCACIFPASLVRKSDTVGSAMDVNLGETEADIQELKQTFIAQTSYLKEVAFDVAISDDAARGGYCVRIEDEEKQKVIAEENISAQDAGNGSYTYIPVKRWIRKGREYSVSVTAEGIEGFSVFYSLRPEEAAPGNQVLYLNGEAFANQAVMEYTYGFPLNIKNVACLWAYILVVGLSILEILRNKEIGEGTAPIEKLEQLLDRYQIPFLLFESFVIIFFIVRISGTDAVDWDEAYTWLLTTKMTIPEMIGETALDVHPPLYYLLVKGAMAIFGKSIVVARMVSVAGTAMTCLLGITLIRKRFGVKAASLFLLVAGLGTQMIYYNTNVRMYSWMIFFVLAAGLFAYEIIQDEKIGSWILFTVFSLGGVYTQYFAVVPLAAIYIFLLIWFVAQDRKQIKNWVICSLITVAGYLPWLVVAVKLLKREYVGAAGESAASSLKEICDWMFGNHIKFSEYMPAVLFAVAVLCLLLTWKRLERRERAFIAFMGAVFFISYTVCVTFASRMGHVWHNRYLIDTLLFVWLFMIIFIARRGIIIWGISMVWLGIYVMSSYVVIQAWELDTIPWSEQAKQLLEQVQDEKKIAYDYIYYDTLYQYWLPNAEFVWYEDIDVEDIDEDICAITWGGGFYHSALYNSERLQKEKLGTMRLEHGVAGVELWKIKVDSR